MDTKTTPRNSSKSLWEVTDLSFFLITTFAIMVNHTNFIHKKVLKIVD